MAIESTKPHLIRTKAYVTDDEGQYPMPVARRDPNERRVSSSLDHAGYVADLLAQGFTKDEIASLLHLTTECVNECADTINSAGNLGKMDEFGAIIDDLSVCSMSADELAAFSGSESIFSDGGSCIIDLTSDDDGEDRTRHKRRGSCDVGQSIERARVQKQPTRPPSGTMTHKMHPEPRFVRLLLKLWNWPLLLLNNIGGS